MAGRGEAGGADAPGAGESAVTLEERYDVMVAYLRARVEERDWHGVRDAAVDVEIMEARNPELRRRVVDG